MAKNFPSPAVAQGVSYPGMKPNWSKLDCDEKIERLREVYKNLRSRIDYLERTSESHTHDEESGKPVLPVNTYDAIRNMGEEKPNDEVYI
jgi:hypothetical protein